MAITSNRNAPAFAGYYEPVQATNHWRIIDGHYYRDVWCRLSDGSLELLCLLDTTGGTR